MADIQTIGERNDSLMGAQTVIRHAFLTPGYNCWNFWTSAGAQPMTNPGTSHRLLETLTYAIDTLAREGWEIAHLSVEQGQPTLVLLRREEEKGGE